MNMELFLSGIYLLCLLLAYAQALAELASARISPRAAEECRSEEVSLQSCGRCLVCRQGLAAEVVRCRSCRTPHHRDCWEYVGRCSVFACKGVGVTDPGERSAS